MKSKQEPEIGEALDRAFDALDGKAAEYKEKYPGSKIIDCAIDSFSQTGITVTFYGLGILEDGGYEEAGERVTKTFALTPDLKKPA